MALFKFKMSGQKCLRKLYDKQELIRNMEMSEFQMTNNVSIIAT